MKACPLCGRTWPSTPLLPPVIRWKYIPRWTLSLTSKFHQEWTRRSGIYKSICVFILTSFILWRKTFFCGKILRCHFPSNGGTERTITVKPNNEQRNSSYFIETFVCGCSVWMCILWLLSPVTHQHFNSASNRVSCVIGSFPHFSNWENSANFPTSGYWSRGKSAAHVPGWRRGKGWRLCSRGNEQARPHWSGKASRWIISSILTYGVIYIYIYASCCGALYIEF